MGIVALAFSALWAAQRALYRSLTAEARPAADRAAALTGLAELAGRLRCAWDDGDEQHPAMRGGRDEEGVVRLEFLSMRPTDSDRDLRYARPCRIGIEEISAPDGTRHWVCSEWLLPRLSSAEPPAAIKKNLAHMRFFRVFFHDGNAWTENWPPAEGAAARLPRAVRLEIEDSNGMPASVEAWIARDSLFEPAGRLP
jgi:hypothetical protein